jgi:hypothetical protein
LHTRVFARNELRKKYFLNVQKLRKQISKIVFEKNVSRLKKNWCFDEKTEPQHPILCISLNS